MTSVDALILQATRELPPIGAIDSMRMNSALAAAAYKLRFPLNWDNVPELMDRFKKVTARKEGGYHAARQPKRP